MINLNGEVINIFISAIAYFIHFQLTKCGFEKEDCAKHLLQSNVDARVLNLVHLCMELRP